MKLLADVGLVGFPNAGKSTLISRISAARPKIADYPFTTLEPNLGVVSAGDETFVVADIPGLIEGAHLGHGLGVQFLRHIERTRLLVHLVDVSEATGRDPVDDFRIVMEELEGFSPDLVRKPMFVVASKVDVAQDPARIDALKALAAEKHLPFYEISSVTGQGIEDLKYNMAQFLSKTVEEELKQIALDRWKRPSGLPEVPMTIGMTSSLQGMQRAESQLNQAAQNIAQWPSTSAGPEGDTRGPERASRGNDPGQEQL